MSNLHIDHIFIPTCDVRLPTHSEQWCRRQARVLSFASGLVDMWIAQVGGSLDDWLRVLRLMWSVRSLNQCFVFPQVFLSVPALPLLEKGESFSCSFQGSHSPAVVTETGVSCQSPGTRRVPAVPPGHGECILPHLTWLFVVSAAELMRLEFSHCFELFNFRADGLGCVLSWD